MASVDSVEQVTEFAALHEAGFPILSDATKETSEAFGVLSAMGYAKRWTFYIDTNGVIVEIDKQVNPVSAGPDLAANLARLDLHAMPPTLEQPESVSKEMP